MNKTVNKISAGFTLDQDIVSRIEENRGIAKRSTYVNEVLRKALMKE
ncbi:hypothetical protein Mpsy_3124 [Methanolobus psychrophilus R15]|nr:hypothetical protein Mpsy_3124 [Methanolobus psychrophilus R15]